MPASSSSPRDLWELYCEFGRKVAVIATFRPNSQYSSHKSRASSSCLRKTCEHTHRRSLRGAWGLSPKKALTHLHFFPANISQNVQFLALFGPESWNYYFDVFHNFDNYPTKTRTEDYNRAQFALNFSFVGLLLQVILSVTSWFWTLL